MTYDSADALNVATATYDELKARFIALAPVEAAVRDERKALATEIEIRERDAAVAARVGVLTDDQKAALKAQL